MTVIFDVGFSIWFTNNHKGHGCDTWEILDINDIMSSMLNFSW